MDSSSYLMMLYVTLEQESALRDFFGEQGWMFCKPDLSVTTDKLGPSVPCKQDPDEETAFTETNMFPVVKPSFPTIKINSILSNIERKKTFIPRKGKRKAKSLLKKPVIPVKQTRGAKDKTDATVEESDENKGTESTKAIEAEDDSQFEIKIERDNSENESPDITDTGSLNEDTDGDGDDDFRDKDDMDYDNEVETAESVENASGKGESVEPADGSVVDDNAASESTTNKTQVKKNSEPLICTVCLKIFSSKNTLSKHMVRHGEKSYRCHICSKGFYRIDELKHHIQNVHEAKSGNLHICDVCGKMYKNKSGLLVHHQYKHGNDPKNDLTCKVCDKMLSCRKKRLEHERRHVEGFKFTECDKCGRKFKNIEEHKWSCSQEPCTERHNCGDCGAMFLSQKYLQKHMKAKHGFSYTCVACGLTFSKKKDVMDHASNCYNVVFTEVLEESFT